MLLTNNKGGICLKKYSSLAHFLEEHMSNSIKKVLLDYIKENEMYTDREVYENPEKYQLNMEMQITIPYDSYFKAPEYDLDFDIVVEATTTVTELVGDELQTNLFQDRFTLTLSAKLKDGLHDIYCHNIQLGDDTRPYDKENSLSRFLVPY